ncbi:UNVERIFIED_CONTAM: hypothetical protein O8I53_08305 [Campylobacter lari]
MIKSEANDLVNEKLTICIPVLISQDEIESKIFKVSNLNLLNYDFISNEIKDKFIN